MDESVIARMVQIGIVTAVDSSEHKCRVKFPDTGLTSDWLRVLRQVPGVNIYSGGSDTHDHGVVVSAWMPKVNDTVVVLYIPVFNSDGFVIGVV